MVAKGKANEKEYSNCDGRHNAAGAVWVRDGCGNRNESTIVPEVSAVESAETMTSPSPVPDPLAELESALTEEEKAMIPEIEGLFRTKVGKEYTYFALEGNEYGLQAGENAGVYREEVYCQIVEIGSDGYLTTKEGDMEKTGGVFGCSCC
jgi:hypothetical protein